MANKSPFSVLGEEESQIANFIQIALCNGGVSREPTEGADRKTIRQLNNPDLDLVVFFSEGLVRGIAPEVDQLCSVVDVLGVGRKGASE